MIRLTTVNLFNGRADVRDLDRVVARLRPDVVIAQEVGFDAADLLARRLPHGRAEGSDDHTGRAMVARFPLEVSLLEMPYRAGLRSTIEVDGVAVDLLGVHLANPIDGFTRVVDRRRQCDALEPIISEEGRRVLAGDLNATPMWPAYRRLTRHLDDGVAAHVARNGGAASRTWGYTPRWPAVLRIDHVLVQGLEVTAVDVSRVSGCDHRALTVDLSLR